MIYGIIIIVYLLNFFFAIKLIFNHKFKMPNFHYTLLLLMLFPFLTPLFHLLIFLDERMLKHTLQYQPTTIRGNAKLFNNAETLFDDLIEEISKAEHYILINLFIFNTDQIGKKIIQKLEEQQAKGVHITIIYDLYARFKLKKKYFKTLKSKGAHILPFMPLFIGSTFNPNFRNHRKCILIDHRVAYLGGFNIGDEYLSRDPKLGLWSDLEVKITGNVQPILPIIQQDLKLYNKSLKERLLTLPSPELHKDWSDYRLVASGLEKWGINGSLFTYIHLIHQAKSSIQIMTPYLIMTDGLLDALVYKASQGCKVSVILPSKNDHILVNNASRAMARRLLHPNIYIYLYSKTAFMHSKVMLIDDEQLFVTSANLDNRSLYFNLELGAMITDQPLIEMMQKEFQDKKQKSKLFTKDDCRLRDLLALLFASYL